MAVSKLVIANTEVYKPFMIQKVCVKRLWLSTQVADSAIINRGNIG